MKALAFHNSSIDSLHLINLPTPTPAPDEILVRIHAVSINPVDTKIRKTLGPENLKTPRILGYDASGTIEAIGENVTTLNPGDEVYYSGNVTRPGSNAQYQTVQADLAALKPKNLTHHQAAALPLVSITAHELLFERMLNNSPPTPGHTLLVINGAGGVGSALIPLAKNAGFNVVATASRPETAEHCRSLGSDHILNHHQPLRPQAEAIGHPHFPLIANLHDTELYWEQTAELLAPLGTLGLIVETKNPLHIGNLLRLKSPRIVWEYMPTRPIFQTPDKNRHQQILTQIATLIDATTLPNPHTTHLGPLTPENLRHAHLLIESQTTLGKITLHQPHHP